MDGDHLDLALTAAAVVAVVIVAGLFVASARSALMKRARRRARRQIFDITGANGANIDRKTVEGFGAEWATYDQAALDPVEHQRLFDTYFAMFPFNTLGTATGFDLGCGSGRWSKLAAPKVGALHCFDPSPEAVEVARRNLADLPNVSVGIASANDMPLGDASQDFGYCLGVLHHVPDTQAGLDAATRKLKPGAPFLLYLYYALDDRPAWYRAMWRASDMVRRAICVLPSPLKIAVTFVIAATVYWPFARLSRIAGPNWPLASYGRLSFYTMRTDALDRFGTRLEKRFTKVQIERMMRRAGLDRITFSATMPKWVALGWKTAATTAG